MLPAVSGDHCNASASLSDGVIHPSVCRGRPFSECAAASRSCWVWMHRSVPFGKYWRNRPLVFSFLSALPWRLGIAEVELDTGIDRELGVLGHLFALVPRQRRPQIAGRRLTVASSATRMASVFPARLVVGTAPPSGTSVRPRSRSRSGSCP